MNPQVSANITTQQKVVGEVLMKQKEQVKVAKSVISQIENEIGNLIDNEVSLDDEDLADID